MANKGGIIGGIITLVIGGAVFSVNKTDIAKHFSKDTGMSQQQAEQYVENISEDDLVSYDKVGAEFITEGNDIIKALPNIDCINYEYEWESSSLSCEKGKTQLKNLADSEIELGKAYVVLVSESASTEDISTVIRLIDKVNTNLSLDIVNKILDSATILESKKINSYNKALLQAALDSTTKK